jgi:hypothetical protein
MNRMLVKTLLFSALVSSAIGGGTTVASTYPREAFETVFYDDDGNYVGIVGYSCTRGVYRAGIRTLNSETVEFGTCP